MILLGILLLFAPPVASVMTLIVALRLVTTRRLLSWCLIGLNVLQGLLMLWEFQYDLGIRLPDTGGFQDAVVTETNLFILVSLILGTLVIAIAKWPAKARLKWLAVAATLLWAAILLAGLVTSQLDFRY